jgi:NifU-like protein involved in Fe-S cluster formation
MDTAGAAAKERAEAAGDADRKERRCSMDLVSPEFLDHFMNPRNYGTIEDPDGTGMGGSPECDDWLLLTIRVEGGRITDIRFQCRGCSAAIATSSATTVLASGLTIAEAEALSADEIERAVGGLSEDKRHCSLLGEEALKDAIADYLGSKGKKR